MLCLGINVTSRSFHCSRVRQCVCVWAGPSPLSVTFLSSLPSPFAVLYPRGTHSFLPSPPSSLAVSRTHQAQLYSLEHPIARCICIPLACSSHPVSHFPCELVLQVTHYLDASGSPVTIQHQALFSNWHVFIGHVPLPLIPLVTNLVV